MNQMAKVANGYDVEAIRADFPILSRTVHGKPLVYLDNGASAQKPKAVIDKISETYSNEYANVHRGLHFLSNAATEAYEDARETVRSFLNAPTVDEVIFTRSSTEGINLVAQSFGGMRIGEVLKICQFIEQFVRHQSRSGNGKKVLDNEIDTRNRQQDDQADNYDSEQVSTEQHRKNGW